MERGHVDLVDVVMQLHREELRAVTHSSSRMNIADQIDRGLPRRRYRTRDITSRNMNATTALSKDRNMEYPMVKSDKRHSTEPIKGHHDELRRAEDATRVCD